MKRLSIGTIRRPGTVLLDDEDYKKVSQYKWHVDSKGYAKRTFVYDGKQKYAFMHVEILPVEKDNGEQCDHVNGNKLDNRKSNLRRCTNTQNQWNKKTRRDSISGYKGVHWFKPSRKWRARINVNGKCTYIGLYINKELAAAAYNEKAIELYGEFAWLNDI